MSTEEVLRRLQKAGLDSIPGGGGEILVDEVRKRNTTKCNTDQWLEVMETAHGLGLPPPRR
jgi:cyclic dehypoxanthinyl futalosine synthase